MFCSQFDTNLFGPDRMDYNQCLAETKVYTYLDNPDLICVTTRHETVNKQSEK